MSVLAPGRNLVLIGLMGSGKSTVGRLVAQALGRRFVDTDDVIESEDGRSIADIFATEGERAFRAIEAGAVRRVSALRGQVLAVGGGAVLDPSSVTSLRGNGDLVWLDAPISALVMHLAGEGEQRRRPLLDDSQHGAPDLARTLARMRRDRHDAYARAASHTIDTQGRPPEVLADQVLAWARTQPGLLAREERL